MITQYGHVEDKYGKARWNHIDKSKRIEEEYHEEVTRQGEAHEQSRQGEARESGQGEHDLEEENMIGKRVRQLKKG